MRKQEVLKLVEEVVNQEETAGMLDKAIQHHERMKNSYFWSSPSHAHSRRKYEADNSFRYKIEMTNGYVEIVQNVECSCANIYYEMYIDLIINDVDSGEKLDVRFLKQLKDAIENNEIIQ